MTGATTRAEGLREAPPRSSCCAMGVYSDYFQARVRSSSKAPTMS
jgi:hypothetical protein